MDYFAAFQLRDGKEGCFQSIRQLYFTGNMQEFDLSQQVCALCGDDSITQHIETGAIPAQGRGSQL